MMSTVWSAAKAAISTPLALIEQRHLRAAPGLAAAPIFIISLPRSGSTLFYLLLTRYFRLTYFSNLASRFPTAPTAVNVAMKRFGSVAPPPDLRSYYGNTFHWNSPSQAYQVWNRWLDPSLDYIAPESLDARAVREMRATIGQFQARLGGPFCSKWQRHLPRLRALAAAFPEAVFIYLERAAASTAQSLLAGRREFLGDEAAWLSARPSSYQPAAADTPIDQVCRQVCHLRDDAERYMSVIGRDRFLSTRYEAVCRAPAAVLDEFADWYRTKTGVTLVRRGTTLPPLSVAEKPKLSQDECARIVDTLARLGSGERRRDR